MNTFGFFKYRNAWRYNGPPHQEPMLQTSEWQGLLKQGGLLVRNTYDFDHADPTSFWYVIKDQYGGLDELSPRVRNKIRRALRFFEYRIVPFEEFIQNAFPILEDTFAHYKVHDRKMNRKVFSEYLEHCRLQALDCWGIFDRTTQQMVGFCTVKVWDDCCEYGFTGINTQYKTHGYYPYYGLYHFLNGYYLETKGFRYVSDGSRTITNHSQIHDYLIHNFRFRKSYCRLAVHYSWWMKILVKTLYPFRKIIPVPQIKAILFMESLTR